MTPLEAARLVAASDPPLLQDVWCRLCYQQVQAFGVNPETPAVPHAPGCPWLVMPQIVAELEDLERIRQRTYAAALAKAQAGTLDCSTDVEGLTR